MLNYEGTKNNETKHSQMLEYRHEIGEWYCLCCGKTAVDGHIQSKEHKKRYDETLQAEELAGAARSQRYREKDGMTGYVDKKNALAFWGDALPGLPCLARDKHSKAPVMLMPGRHKIYPRHLNGSFELAMVEYTGAGRYHPGDKVIRWADVPDDINELPWEERKFFHPKEGYSWWPVVLCILNADKEESLKRLRKKDCPLPLTKSGHQLHYRDLWEKGECARLIPNHLKCPDSRLVGDRTETYVTLRLVMLVCFYQLIEGA